MHRKYDTIASGVMPYQRISIMILNTRKYFLRFYIDVFILEALYFYVFGRIITYILIYCSILLSMPSWETQRARSLLLDLLRRQPSAYAWVALAEDWMQVFIQTNVLLYKQTLSTHSPRPSCKPYAL